MEAAVVHTGTVHAHTHTTGFTVQEKGLIRDERRPHIAPCKGPLSPFLLQCSVKLWETNDLGATALCATEKEKAGGGGSGFVGGPASPLSRLPKPSPCSNAIPTVPSPRTAQQRFLCLQLLLQPSQQQNCNRNREGETPFPTSTRGFSPVWLLELNS